MNVSNLSPTELLLIKQSSIDLAVAAGVGLGIFMILLPIDVYWMCFAKGNTSTVFGFGTPRNAIEKRKLEMDVLIVLNGIVNVAAFSMILFSAVYDFTGNPYACSVATKISW
jgi:hypothetical protein